MEVIMELLTAVGALVGSMALGATKKYTGFLDGKIGAVIKPVQPLLVLGASFLLPKAAVALGIAPVDAAQFISAPTATLAVVSAREALKRLRR